MIKKSVIKHYTLMLILIFSFFYVNISVLAKNDVVFDTKTSIENNDIIYCIDISKNSEICGLSMNIIYNKDLLEVTESELGKVFNGGIGKINDNIKGKVIISYISTASLVNSGKVLSIKFKPKQSSVKNIKISCEIKECIDIDCNDINAKVGKDVFVENPIYESTSGNEQSSLTTKNDKLENSDDNAFDEKSSVSSKTNVSDNSASKESLDIFQSESDSINGEKSSSDTQSEISSKPDEKNNNSQLVKSKNVSNKYYLILIILLFIIAIIAILIIIYRRKRNEKN